MAAPKFIQLVNGFLQSISASVTSAVNAIVATGADGKIDISMMTDITHFINTVFLTRRAPSGSIKYSPYRLLKRAANLCQAAHIDGFQKVEKLYFTILNNHFAGWRSFTAHVGVRLEYRRYVGAPCGKAIVRITESAIPPVPLY